MNNLSEIWIKDGQEIVVEGTPIGDNWQIDRAMMRMQLSSNGWKLKDE